MITSLNLKNVFRWQPLSLWSSQISMVFTKNLRVKSLSFCPKRQRNMDLLVIITSLLYQTGKLFLTLICKPFFQMSLLFLAMQQKSSTLTNTIQLILPAIVKVPALLKDLSQLSRLMGKESSTKLIFHTLQPSSCNDPYLIPLYLEIA